MHCQRLAGATKHYIYIRSVYALTLVNESKACISDRSLKTRFHFVFVPIANFRFSAIHTRTKVCPATYEYTYELVKN